jgi:hypothetical protein
VLGAELARPLGEGVPLSAGEQAEIPTIAAARSDGTERRIEYL